MDYIAYFMLGVGIGMAFYYIFYSDNSQAVLDRMRHDLAVRKEWFRMLAVQKTKNPKWPASWEEKLGEKYDRRNQRR